MIKCQEFQFTKLEVPDHWVAFPNFGECVKSRQHFATRWEELPVKLDPEKAYQVACDQSTSNSGIFIKDYENTEVYMIELSRDKGQDATDYIWKFELLLHGLLEGCNVTHLIYERPINSGSYRSSQVLFQLEGAIRGLSKRYAEFRAAKLDHIENSSWRAVVVNSADSRDYERKDASRVSVQRLWPWTADYGYSLGKDNDIYEAIGILFGWFFNAFDHLGRPYMRGERTTRTIGGLIIPGLPAEVIQKKLTEEGIESELRVENPKYSIYQNLVSGVDAYKTLCVEITSKYAMLCLCVECNIKWVDPDVMTLIVTDASCVSSALREVAGGEFHFVI